MTTSDCARALYIVGAELAIEYIRAQITASRSFDRVANAVMAAQTDDDAIARIGHVLHVDERLATSTYHSALRDLRPSNVHRDQRLQQLIAESNGLN